MAQLILVPHVISRFSGTLQASQSLGLSRERGGECERDAHIIEEGRKRHEIARMGVRACFTATTELL